jgi:general L-amino acid transport system permease protein
MGTVVDRPVGVGNARGVAAFLNNRHVRQTIIQGVLFFGTVALFAYFIGNAVDNMARLGISSGYEFMERPANFAIGEFLVAYSPADSYGRAIWVGLLNTMKVAFIGCVLCTVLGVFLGILRLSPNPLLSGLVQAYIEVIRNTPLLLQLFFWYAVAQRFPGPRQALSPIEGFFLSNRGVVIPWLEWHAQLDFVFLALVLGVVATFVVDRAARRRRDATGEGFAVWPWLLALVFGLPVLVAIIIGAPIVWSVPELRGFNFVGGMTLTPEFFALLIGLVLYTAAFVAEIVRSGIQSVGKGQWEAARAVGLRDGKIMRMIILPQALRVIIPPMTSSYLNLTKNSSLAVAIGFPDLVAVGNTVMNQTGQSFEVIAIFMAIYLTISLSISAFMNWYNARVALKER